MILSTGSISCTIFGLFSVGQISRSVQDVPDLIFVLCLINTFIIFWLGLNTSITCFVRTVCLINIGWVEEMVGEKVVRIMVAGSIPL